MKNILITGGTGFIGFQLAKHHHENGDRVYLIDNLFKNNSQFDREFELFLLNENVFFFKCDLTEKIKNHRIPNIIDCVYHLAAINGTDLFYKIPYDLCRNNILITINLLDFLKKIKVGKLVYASTSEVYAGGEDLNLIQIPTAENVPVVFPQPTDKRFSYATSKFLGEFLSFNFGDLLSIPTSVVRFHNIYGPRMGNRHVIPNFIEKALSNSKDFILNGADNTRAFCYIDDAINAISLVAQSTNTDKKILHVGNENEEISIIELAKVICQIMGKEFSFSNNGAPKMSVNRRCPSTSELLKLTGFAAKVPLYDGLKNTIDWYLNNQFIKK